jgi:NAD(P)-dependent dehydrogenase (short-subunit alcohol dehydrogenase family)
MADTARVDAQKYTTKLHDKHILIIGGTSGIGLSIAEACLEHGAHVIISSSQHHRISSTLSSLQHQYPSAALRVQGYACNLGDPATLETQLSSLFDSVGPLDHIVFTAADALVQMPVSDFSVDAIQRAGLIRFIAPLLVAKIGGPRLRPGSGSSLILTGGSVAAKPMPGWSVIAAYAAGLEGMVRNLALDLAPIRVNLVAPGVVDTGLWRLEAEEKERFAQTVREGNLTGVFSGPENIIEAYLWLMKDRNVTGTVARTDAGVLLK